MDDNDEDDYSAYVNSVFVSVHVCWQVLFETAVLHENEHTVKNLPS